MLFSSVLIDRKAFRRDRARGMNVPDVTSIKIEITTEEIMTMMSRRLQKRNTGDIFMPDG